MSEGGTSFKNRGERREREDGAALLLRDFRGVGSGLD